MHLTSFIQMYVVRIPVIGKSYLSAIYTLDWDELT
jgi:hypothetical protein